tara:strand:- start:71 stop:838 length:768 start_codon:yes stop_codon:yes gene_type:complete
MQSHDKYKSTIGFIDILFNILVGFAFLFIVAFLLIKPEAKREDFDRKAEFIVVMEWDKERQDDIDLYVQDPSNTIVHFRNARANFMHLDKDDLGKRNDTIMVNGVEKIVKINREVVTIRGIVPGEYIVNVHYYSDYSEHANVTRGPMSPLEVKVTVYKVNPYSEVWQGTKTFTRKGQEETFVRFTMDKNGGVKPSFRFLKRRMVSPLMIHSANHPAPGPPSDPHSIEYNAAGGGTPSDLQNLPQGANEDDAAGGF